MRLALLALLLAGCAAAPRRTMPGPDDYPGELRAVDALEPDVLWRQRVTAVWGEDERRGFDAAIQKAGDTLTVLGLSPAGSTGFAFVLRGGVIEVQDRMPEPLPFPPRFVVLDVQRAFYPWLAGAPEAADGVREGVVDGERVRETWRGGRLVERTFERVDGMPAGAITVRYERAADGAGSDWVAAPRIVLDNGWFGYRLEIDTHAETRLDAPEDAASRP